MAEIGNRITPAMIQALWRNLPSPYEIDMRDEAAARQAIKAVMAAASRIPRQ